ncbi:hypothetical protein [Cognatilysobacter terrigena]|uniref:hypothetical protein n=1 Tax=Cognatilysobacter terrigena TaxID=2488749 RepID=UPI001061F621|nr:hypothetical protein [Lysobacter terrigena]
MPPVASDDAPAGTLPTPAATPGTAVTGMPTQPPPPPAADAIAEAMDAAPPVDASATAPTDAATDPSALPAPVDETATADATAPNVPPSTTSAAPATAVVTTADTNAAAGVINQYMAALTANAPARAQTLWATTPNDSTVLQLARGGAFNVDIGAPSPDAAGHVTVPVDVRGKADDGGDRQVQAVYTLQRTATGTWRIYNATTRDAAP